MSFSEPLGDFAESELQASSSVFGNISNILVAACQTWPFLWSDTCQLQHNLERFTTCVECQAMPQQPVAVVPVNCFNLPNGLPTELTTTSDWNSPLFVCAGRMQ